MHAFSARLHPCSQFPARPCTTQVGILTAAMHERKTLRRPGRYTWATYITSATLERRFGCNGNRQVILVDSSGLLGIQPVSLGDLIHVEFLQGFSHDKDV